MKPTKEALDYGNWLSLYQELSKGSMNQYIWQVNKLFKEYPLFSEMDDNEMVNCLRMFVNKAPRSYIRKFALKYWLEYKCRENVLKRLKPYFRKVRLKPRKYATRSLTKEQIVKVIQAVNKDSNLKTICMVAYDTALRISSILNLKAENINRDANTGLYYLTVKIKRGKIVTKYIEAQTARNLKAITYKKGYVFLDAEGKRLTYYDVWTNLKNITRKALGLGFGISFHWFRSSRAIDLLKKYDILTAQRMLDHSNIATTERYVSEAGVESKDIILKEKKWSGIDE